MKKNKFTRMARYMMLLIAVLAVGSVFAYGVNVDSLSMALLAVATAPFAFVIPDALKTSMSEAEQAGIKSLGDQIATYINGVEKGMSQSDINAAVKSAWDMYVKENGISKDALTKLQENLKEQGIEITALKESGGRAERPKSVKQQIKEWITSADFKSAVNGKSTSTTEIKAAVPLSAYVEEMEGGEIDGLNPLYDVAPELLRYEVDRRIGEAPRERNFLYQLLSKGSTDAAFIVWFNRINKEGGAAFIPEYGLKPLLSWTYERKTAQPHKIAVMVKVSTEMLEDATFIEGEIRRVMDEDLNDKIEAELFSGSTLPSLDAVGVPYTGTDLDGTIPTPNNADAVRAATLQMRNLNFTPNVLILSPTANAQMDLTKSDTGNYLKPETDALLKGLRIIETTQIGDDEFALMDTSKYTIKNKGGLHLSTGIGVNQIADSGGKQYATDFELNAVSIILERRLFAYVDDLYAGAIFKDEFDTVKTALEA